MDSTDANLLLVPVHGEGREDRRSQKVDKIPYSELRVVAGVVAKCGKTVVDVLDLSWPS